MFTNKYNERNNVLGIGIKKLRERRKVSQRVIAEMLQENGIDVDKNAVQRMESGQRFITDIELLGIMKTFDISFDDLRKLCEKQ